MWGLWGSPSTSLKLWCLRWTATHSLGEMLVSIQVPKRIIIVSAGRSRMDPCESTRWREPEGISVAGWLRASPTSTATTYCTRSPLQTSTDVPSGTVSLFSSDRTKAGANAPALALSDSYRMLGGSDILRLHPLTSLGRLVGDLGTLVEGLEALAGYAGVVHEEILAPIIRGDKAVALLVAEPLHCSLGHNQAPTFRVYGPPPNKNATLSRSRGWRSVSCKPTLLLRYEDQYNRIPRLVVKCGRHTPRPSAPAGPRKGDLSPAFPSRTPSDLVRSRAAHGFDTSRPSAPTHPSSSSPVLHG